MHPEIKPQHRILLAEALAVTKIVKGNSRVRHVLAVVMMRAPGLRVLLDGDVNIVLAPLCHVLQHCRLLHGQICCVGRQDIVAPVFVVLVPDVLVDHQDLVGAVAAPVATSIILALNERGLTAISWRLLLWYFTRLM